MLVTVACFLLGPCPQPAGPEEEEKKGRRRRDRSLDHEDGAVSGGA